MDLGGAVDPDVELIDGGADVDSAAVAAVDKTAIEGGVAKDCGIGDGDGGGGVGRRHVGGETGGGIEEGEVGCKCPSALGGRNSTPSGAQKT